MEPSKRQPPQVESLHSQQYQRLREKAEVAARLLKQAEAARALTNRLVGVVQRRRVEVDKKYQRWQEARDRAQAAADLAASACSDEERLEAEARLDRALDSHEEWAVACRWDSATEAAAAALELLETLSLNPHSASLAAAFSPWLNDTASVPDGSSAPEPAAVRPSSQASLSNETVSAAARILDQAASAAARSSERRASAATSLSDRTASPASSNPLNQTVSVACLSGRLFELEQPSGVIRFWAASGKACSLSLTYSDGSEVPIQPHCIHACDKRKALIIVDKSAGVLAVCDTNGRLRFSVGPKFNKKNKLITQPEDAVSTGDQLVFCCPSTALFMVSMTRPTVWRTTIVKQTYNLKSPIRLAWSLELSHLFVVDEVVKHQQYRLLVFSLRLTKTGAILLPQFQPNSPPPLLLSKARPAVACCDGGGILVSLLDAGNDRPVIKCLDSACASVRWTLPLAEATPASSVTVLCWTGLAELAVCCDGGLRILGPDSVRASPDRPTPASSQNRPSCPPKAAPELPPESEPPTQTDVQIVLGLASSSQSRAASAACLNNAQFLLELPPSGVAVRVLRDVGDETTLDLLSDDCGSRLALAGPCRIRACERNNALILLDQAANAALVCRPDGRLRFRVGPRFSCSYTISNPEDLVSTGRLLAIACPEFGLLFVSMSQPTAWKTCQHKMRIQPRLACPVRLAWTHRLRRLIVVDELDSATAKQPGRYSLYAFRIGVIPTTAVLTLCANLSDPVASLARPCLAVCKEGVLLTVLTDLGASSILCLADDLSAIFRRIRVPMTSPDDAVVDLCWVGQRLAVCSGRLGIWMPARAVGGLHPETDSEETPRAATEGGSHVGPSTAMIDNAADAPMAIDSSDKALSVACRLQEPQEDQLLVLELPSRLIRVYNSSGARQGDFNVFATQRGDNETHAINIRAHCVRVCDKTGLVILVDQAAPRVSVCESNGRLSFRVGPKFSDAYALSPPEDAVSTGGMLGICSPDLGIYLVSLNRPESWRTTMANRRARLVRPVRLSWLASRRLLIVADQASSRGFKILAFTIETSKTGASLTAQSGADCRPPQPLTLQSLTPPSLLCVRDTILVAVRTPPQSSQFAEEGPRVLVLSGADCSVSGVLRTLACWPDDTPPVTDICWLPCRRRLAVCAGGQVRLLPRHLCRQLDEEPDAFI